MIGAGFCEFFDSKFILCWSSPSFREEFGSSFLGSTGDLGSGVAGGGGSAAGGDGGIGV
jgi:hypothetical protein